MNVDSIKNGFVIDHISAGRGMKLYHLLGLDALDITVAIIKNVPSKLMGKKDIIKIDALLDLNLDMIGYAEPGATINVIEDGELIEKKTLELPQKLTNVLKCKNPRCISQTEQELDQVFRLSDKTEGTYRCIYCEAKGE